MPQTHQEDRPGFDPCSEPTEAAMTTAIGVVMTEHIVAGRLEDMRLAGDSVRYPQNIDEVDALSALPVGDVVDILAKEIVSVINNAQIDAIGVAVPGGIRHGVVEDSPN